MSEITKLAKIAIISLCLLNLINISAENELNVAIFLDRTKNDGYSSEEKKVREGNVGVMVDELKNFILDEVAIIASAPLLRGLLLASDKKGEMYNEVGENELFHRGKWSLFRTNDNEFVVLIPKSKYPQIKKQKDLEIIGLNPNELRLINYHYENRHFH